MQHFIRETFGSEKLKLPSPRKGHPAVARHSSLRYLSVCTPSPLPLPSPRRERRPAYLLGRLEGSEALVADTLVPRAGVAIRPSLPRLQLPQV